MKRPESALYGPIVIYLKSQRAFAYRNNNTPIFQPCSQGELFKHGLSGIIWILKKFNLVIGRFRKMSEDTPKGLPDILAVFLGTLWDIRNGITPMVIAVECKAEGGKLSEDQENVKAMMESRGVIWITAGCTGDALGDVMAVVEKLRSEGRIA